MESTNRSSTNNSQCLSSRIAKVRHVAAVHVIAIEKEEVKNQWYCLVTERFQMNNRESILTVELGKLTCDVLLVVVSVLLRANFSFSHLAAKGTGLAGMVPD